MKNFIWMQENNDILVIYQVEIMNCKNWSMYIVFLVLSNVYKTMNGNVEIESDIIYMHS